MATVQSELHPSRPHPSLPFGSVKAEPTRAYERDAPTYLLLRQRLLEPGEFESPSVETVEVMGLWGSTILFVRHLSMRQGFVIGEAAPQRVVDFEVSSQELGALSARLVETRDGAPHATIPRSASARLKQRGEFEFTPIDAARVALLSGTVVEIRLGELTFRIANMAAATSTPRAGLRATERPVLAAFALCFTTAAALLASLALWMPPMGLTDGDDIDSDRLSAMKQYLSAEAERNREELAEKAESGQKNADPGVPAETAQGREGALGGQHTPITNHRAAVRGDSTNTELSRAQALDAARSFGMIDLLGSLSSSEGSSSPFARNAALGHDDVDAEGAIWGDEVGESTGNGLRLAGLDNGGGGHGLGVALGGIGTCSSADCGPSGGGNSLGRVGGSYKNKGPSIREASNATVSGRLPPEVVQRIVRQNYGRFRLCYENGLRTNPNLTGRVTARFVIGREGSVANVQNGGSDIPDAGVVSCVVQAFYGLSFPTPENGIVSVSYPIMFSPG